MDFFFDLVGELFGYIYQWIITPFKDLHSLPGLIFGKGTSNTVLRTFTPIEASQIYTKGITTSSILAGFLLLAGIVIWGIRISKNTFNPNNRTALIEFLGDMLIVAIVLSNINMLYQFLFTINNGVVTLFEGAYNVQIAELSDEITNDAGDVLGLLIINLCIFCLSIWANFYYYMRKLTLMLLMCLGPIMVVLYMIPSTRNVTFTWLKELFGTIIIQGIHAMVFWFVALMAVGQDLQVIPSLLLYIVFIPVSESIRGLFNFGGQTHNGLSRAAAYSGLSALGNVYKVAKSAMDGNSSLSDRLRNAGQRLAKGEGLSGAAKALGSNKGTDIGTSSLAEKVFKAGDITSKFGKAAFGMAGAIGGATLGEKGSDKLASIGYSAGGKIGGFTGRAGALAIAQGKKGLDSFKTGFNNSKNGNQNLANEVVDKYAESEMNNWALQNKDQFMEDQRKRFPDATNESLENKWQGRLAEKKEAFKNNARPLVEQMMKENGKLGNSDRLANKVSEDLTKDWAKNNKDDFMKNYANSNPIKEGESTGEYKNRMNQAWNNTLSQKGSEISDKAMSIAKSEGKGLPGSYINKGQFANKMANEMKSIDGNNSYFSTAKQAVGKVASGSVLSSNPKDGLNTGYITQQMAHAKTESDKQAYLSQNPGGSAEWKTKESGVFSQNLAQISSNMPKRVPASSLSLPKMQLSQPNTVALQFAQNVASGFQNVGSDVANSVSSTIGNVAEVASILSGNAVELTKEQATQKQLAFKNAVALTAGIVGGVKAYQGAANVAMKVNPYNNAVNQSVAEVSDITQMAQKTSNGHVASGAIQLVTTPNESYIQVRDHSGQTQVVSRRGSGDSSLQEGQVVYQDLQINNNTMTPQKVNGVRSSAYMLDSGGGKVLTNKELNINPNELVGNRSMQAPKVVEVEAFNQQVDQGQFHIDDIVGNTENLQMILEKGRSYLVATDSNSGESYRVSPYGKGDARLSTGQIVQVAASIVHKKVVINDDLFINEQGEKTNVRFNTSFDPNSLVSVKPNPRTHSRKSFEENRRNIGVI